LWLHSLKVAQLLRSAACLHTNQSRSYLNHLVHYRHKLARSDVHNLRHCSRSTQHVLLLYVIGLMKYKLFVSTAAGKIEFKYS